MQLVGIILLGIFTLVIIFLITDVQNGNELDYYLLQEVTEASMYDAVDLSYYRATGILKVDRDMFLESFNRRFAQAVSSDRDYTIKIIDFNEAPPKVSVEVSAPTVASVKGESILVVNRVSGIIETIYDNYVESVPLGDGIEWETRCAIDTSGTLTFKVKSENEFRSYRVLQDGKTEIHSGSLVNGTLSADLNSRITDNLAHSYQIYVTDANGVESSCEISSYTKKEVQVDHTCDNPTETTSREDPYDAYWDGDQCKASQKVITKYIGSGGFVCNSNTDIITVEVDSLLCPPREDDDDPCDNTHFVPSRNWTSPPYWDDDINECVSTYTEWGDWVSDSDSSIICEANDTRDEIITLPPGQCPIGGGR